MSSVRAIKNKHGIVWQERHRDGGRSCAKTFSTKREAVAFAARMKLLVEARGGG